MKLKVICTCSACFKNEITNRSGQRQPGKWVASSTRARHLKKDSADQLPTDSEVGKAEEMVEERDNLIGKISSARDTIYLAVCTLVAWLHLVCGLSRASSSQLLHVLNFIVKTAIHLGSLFASVQTGTSVDSSLFDSFSTPLDVRSAMLTISIEPEIIRSVRCPKCFTPYELNTMPDVCDIRETPRSKPCGAELWATRSTRKGPQRLPRRLYSIQSFESWLEHFLSRPGIEEIIDKSYAHEPSNGSMQSVWDSPAWQCLPDKFSSTPGNLTFSYYIDWFNPFSNKIAGKSVSCGAIMMFCLNLPFDIQHLPENTFFAGITPPPKEPSVTTITALADPIIDQLLPMWSGRSVKTYRHPEGTLTRAAILARTGDLLAVRKAFGFASHSAYQFCSFCKLRSGKMDDLNYLSWKSRNGLEVLLAARDWKAATTKKRRKEIFQEHGVRWSSLHRLPYGDPVQHIVLGVMHNWIEGILQHHVRWRWGLGPAIASANTKTKKSKKEGHSETITAPHPLDDMLQDGDIEDEVRNEELDLLCKESQQDIPAHPSRLHSEASMLSLLEEKSDSDDDDFIPGPDLDSDNSSNSDSDDSGWDDDENDSGVDRLKCVFTDSDLSRIRHCIAYAAIPSWLERPPTNLGEKIGGKFKAHGKLKADQWFTLISIFLPLVIPEIWGNTLPTDEQYAYHSALLDNFHHLVICTNTVCSYSVTPDSPDIYLDHYVQYRKSSQTLFPHTTRPNHHYAMHNAELMKFWGPLIRISEFAGERHNGSLQKINTNNHLWEMDMTMLRQICRRGRLMAMLRSSATDTPMARILNKQKAREQESLISTTIVPIPLDVYDAILAYVNKGIMNDSDYLPFRHIHTYPHPQNARILPISATPINHFQHKGRGYSTFGTHPGNSSVHFVSADQGGPDSGYIESIWKYNVPQIGLSRIFIVISCHRMLSPQDSCRNPYLSHQGFLANIAYSRNPNNFKMVIIEPKDIVGHVAYYCCPPKTFGIEAPITIFINSLHRYRD